MNKRNEIKDLDIPIDDIDCITRYPKHKWVYDLTRLLDSQSTPWSLVKTPEFSQTSKIFDLDHNTEVLQTGEIYLRPSDKAPVYTEVFIIKGEIKKHRHLSESLEELDQNITETDIRITAFVNLHFGKFTGVCVFKSIGNTITQVRLRPCQANYKQSSSDYIRLLSRIYKKPLIINGLTDRDLRESLAS